MPAMMMGPNCGSFCRPTISSTPDGTIFSRRTALELCAGQPAVHILKRFPCLRLIQKADLDALNIRLVQDLRRHYLGDEREAELPGHSFRLCFTRGKPIGWNPDVVLTQDLFGQSSVITFSFAARTSSKILLDFSLIGHVLSPVKHASRALLGSGRWSP